MFPRDGIATAQRERIQGIRESMVRVQEAGPGGGGEREIEGFE
jgi:hypothetical protein